MTKPTICLDLDGTLATYNGWQGIETIGEPIQGAVAFTHELARFARIVIYTTRTKEYPVRSSVTSGASDPDYRPVLVLVDIVREWLDRHDFAYDEIYCGQGKPFSVAIIDDRAVTCRPQESVHPEFEYQFALAAAATLIDKLHRKDVSSAVFSGSLN